MKNCYFFLLFLYFIVHVHFFRLLQAQQIKETSFNTKQVPKGIEVVKS